MVKKVFKIIGIIIASLLVLAMIAYGILYYYVIGKFEVDDEKYPNSIGYINPETAILNDRYTLCDDEIWMGLHHPDHINSYEGNKKRFRESVQNTFTSFNEEFSGYINYRFLVNCKGEPGWFEIRQTTLEYEKTTFNKTVVNQLLEFTAQPEHWAVIKQKENPLDYYMYVTYRIENGKITEILP